jgi:transposase
MNVPLSLQTRLTSSLRQPDACPVCGGALHEHEEVVTKRQIEIVKKPYIVKEYHVHSYTCPVCGTTHRAVEPEESRGGLFSMGLTALTAYLKGRCHVSFRAPRAFFQDIFGIVVSGGFPAKQIRRAGAALKGAHEQLMERLKREKHLHIDESG